MVDFDEGSDVFQVFAAILFFNQPKSKAVRTLFGSLDIEKHLIL